MKTFEFDGNKYREASKHQKEWGTQIIDELNLKGREIILDLGCGDGTLTYELAKRVPNGRVIGIDASEGMIKTAKKLRASNLTFIKMDINQIDFANEFDLIFSNAALHWIKDHKKLLNNSYRALRNLGEIRWNFAGDGNCSNFYRVIKDVINQTKFQEYFKSFIWPWFMPDVKEYKSLVEESGFKEANVWPENADRYFPTSDEMVKWIDQPSIVPFLSLIPQDEKDIFRNIVVQEMINLTQQRDGSCFETFRRINVKAKKF